MHPATPHGFARTRRRRFAVDLSSTDERGVDLRHQWEMRVGGRVPMPPAELIGSGTFTVHLHGAELHDTLIVNTGFESPEAGQKWINCHSFADMLIIDVVSHGTWRYARSRGNHDAVVTGAQFIARHNDPSWRFTVSSHATKKIVLPVAHLAPLVRGRPVIGSVDAAEMRMLLAFVRTVETELDDLSPAAAEGARNAVHELVAGVLRQRADGAEPQLARPLFEAAKELVNDHLTDSTLSPAMLAHQLNVSPRTLQRAFAAGGVSVTDYIRRQRLEQARLALGTSGGRLSVGELAARLQFTDSSHFIRSFKKEYGQSPGEFARSRGRQPTERG